MTPLIKIDTTDNVPPVIIENPSDFPFSDGEREQYREATDEEYDNWRHWYLGYQDVDDNSRPSDDEAAHPMYKAGVAARKAEK